MEHILLILATAIGFQFRGVSGSLAGYAAVYAMLWLLHRPKGGYR